MAWLDCSPQTAQGGSPQDGPKRSLLPKQPKWPASLASSTELRRMGFVKPPTHILTYWKHTSRGTKLTWVGKVHFWLHNHALRRQWGRAVTMGIDWSLELHCKISHWDSHKPSLFTSHGQVSLSPKPFEKMFSFPREENSNQRMFVNHKERSEGKFRRQEAGLLVHFTLPRKILQQ